MHRVTLLNDELISLFDSCPIAKPLDYHASDFIQLAHLFNTCSIAELEMLITENPFARTPEHRHQRLPESRDVQGK